MVEIFKHVDKFFISLTNYLTYNDIFIIFVGLMLFTMLMVVAFTSRSYEAKLIKAVDKFNSYFIDNPQINEDNLVVFNARMKDKKVPKQLRKSWQQFVLYREGKASSYMSFENCVSNPMKNSTYTRDVKILSILSWIYCVCSLILNCYYCFETNDIAVALRSVLLTPIIILLLNLITQIFLNLRHTAIVSDLFQNYQYFEVNIDKATETLPEYVDYEVLFDRNEIKRGIPILYAYLQKRAEEEQRELERVRLKNVEHEKFNFDEEGIAAALVLERAMQEAENYMAERKKFNQDAEQVNSDMTQEDMNYREITKEYNRQMQVSKETFANFKSQLEDASSSIEANYLKKQQQQELDRQRNLERDFDTATERHNKVIEDLNAELDTIDGFIKQSRQNLERAMKSEFQSYSSKVYDEAKKLVEIREQEKYQKLKNDIVSLEEELHKKNQELEQVYQKNIQMAEQLEAMPETAVVNEYEPDKKKDKKKRKDKKDDQSGRENVPSYDNQPNYVETNSSEESGEYKPLTYQPQSYEDYKNEQLNQNYSEEVNNVYKPLTYEAPTQTSEEEVDEYKPLSYYAPENDSEEEVKQDSEPEEMEYEEVWSFNNEVNNETTSEPEEVLEDNSEDEGMTEYAKYLEQISTGLEDAGIYQNSESEGATNVEDAEQQEGEKVEEQPKRKAGRPRKEKTEEVVVEKRKPGRPKKEKAEVEEQPKRKVGRPKKEVVEVKEEPKRRVGRPRKEKVEVEEQPKRKVGRPKKEVGEVKEEPKRRVGRPKKEKVEEIVAEKRKPGRPKKKSVLEDTDLTDIKDIDKYLQEIDDAIAAENAKMEKTQKELVNKTKLRRKK